VQDLAQGKGIKLNYSDLNKLAMILVRHTVGFGLIEVLLQDKKLQDIVLNAPISMTNIFLRHQDYEECSTNILPSQEDVDSWAAKFRMISGRPLDEAKSNFRYSVRDWECQSKDCDNPEAFVTRWFGLCN